MQLHLLQHVFPPSRASFRTSAIDQSNTRIYVELLLLVLQSALPFFLAGVLLVKGLFILLEKVGDRLAGWANVEDEEEDILLASTKSKRAKRLKRLRKEQASKRRPRFFLLVIPLHFITLSYAADGLIILLQDVLLGRERQDDAVYTSTLVSLISYACCSVLYQLSGPDQAADSMVLKIVAGISLGFNILILGSLSLDMSLISHNDWPNFVSLGTAISRTLASAILASAYHSKLREPPALQASALEEDLSRVISNSSTSTGGSSSSGESSGEAFTHGKANIEYGGEVDDDEDDDEDDEEKYKKRVRAYDLPAILKRMRRFAPYILPYKSRLAQLLLVICIILTLLTNAANILLPRQFGLVVNDLSAGRAPWRNLLIWAFLRSLINRGGLLQILRRALWNPIRQQASRKMDIMCFSHVLELGMKYHNNKRTGEVLAALGRSDSVQEVLSFTLFTLIPIFINLFGSVTYLAGKFGVSVICVVVGTGAAYFATMSLSRDRYAKLRAEYIERRDNTAAIKNESISNVELLKYFSMEPYEINRFSKSLLRNQKADWTWDIYSYTVNMTEELVQVAGTVAGALIIARQIYVDHREIGMFVMFISYIENILMGLDELQWMSQWTNQLLTDTDKLMDILDQKNEILDSQDAEELLDCKGSIDFTNVTLVYEEKAKKEGNPAKEPRKALDDVSFSVLPGQHVALVGETGAGKSSIFKLLFRFFEAKEGSIKVDGKDIRQYTQRSLRQALGVVQQEGSVFNDSIFANIKYGDICAPDARVYEAAKMAQIHDRICEWPKGYQTVVGERGVKLSGGEKQRVNIARTILRNPRILLLDEATSALDSNTEKAIQKQLRQLTRGKTTLAIAHRLSTIAHADKIIVLDKGKIVETGTHDKLLLIEGGHYKKLWEAQTSAGKMLIDEEASMDRGDESLDDV